MKTGIALLAMAALSAGVTRADERAEVPDWEPGATIPVNGRSNPYGWTETELSSRIRSGTLHALMYPVEVTGTIVPDRPLKKLLEGPIWNPVAVLVQGIARAGFGVKKFDDLMVKLGLQDFPQTEGSGAFFVPFPEGSRPKFRMGFTPMKRDGAEGFSLACAICHTGDLFGRKVIGMTNRFPRANDFFLQGKGVFRKIDPGPYRRVTGATRAEEKMYSRSRDNLSFVGGREPAVLGLDTSLAHVALSLAHRAQDDYATRVPELAFNPRDDLMNHVRADSKPMVWWNVKYKNRWLADGSVVSGNPVFTNFIWNEIGRGTDLKELEAWFSRNTRVIEDLTTAVFASKAPRYTDFFPSTKIELASAKRGQVVFAQRCAGCHGVYEKRWDLPESERLTDAEKLETAFVRYPNPTPVVDVGTEPGRYTGMRSLAEGLNPLALSRTNRIRIEPQKGYVPPPLVGIWARWPYFHNNSAPSLCAVLTASDARPKIYYAGSATDSRTDFDDECNGYPLGEQAPRSWREDAEKRFDVSVEGLGNRGHDEGIFLSGGRELLNPAEKRDLIRFLKTL